MHTSTGAPWCQKWAFDPMELVLHGCEMPLPTDLPLAKGSCLFFLSYFTHALTFKIWILGNPMQVPMLTESVIY